MILRRLAVRDFRRFPSFEALLTPGLNVIVGNNEEGKSTLREAIALALFMDPKTKSQDVLGLKRWDASEQFSIELELEEDGRIYTLVKDLQTRTARMSASDPAEVLQDPRTIAARLIELLGLPSRDTFESTVRISQREMTRIHNSKEIADRLQEQVTGGEQDVQASRVLSDLDKGLNALKSTSRINPGPLYALPPQIASKEAELGSRAAVLAHVEKARGTLLEREESVGSLRGELEEKRAIQKACAMRLEVEGKLQTALLNEQEVESKLEQIDAEVTILAQTEGELRQYAAVVDVAQEKLSEMDWLDRQSNEPLPVEEPAPVRPSTGTPGPRKSVIVVGVTLALLGLGGGFLLPPLFVLLVVGLLLVVWEVAMARRGSPNAAVFLAEQAMQNKKTARDEVRRHLDEMLKQVGCSTVAELHKKRETAAGLTRSAERSRAKLEAFLTGQTRQEVEQARKAASKVVRDMKERLDESDMRLAKMDQSSYQRLLRDIADRERSIEQLQGEIYDLSVSVRASQIGVDEIHALEEQIQEQREQLASAQERQRVLALVRHVLEESRTATMTTARDVLQGEVGDLIAKITGGRYSRAVLDANLTIQLIAPERDEPVSVALEKEPSALSTGTVEQVYLAARLSLAKLLSQGRRPPFILDDPFVTFDPVRTAAVLDLCKRLSADSQILLFTCHEEYASSADNVVRLPGLEVGG